MEELILKKKTDRHPPSFPRRRPVLLAAQSRPFGGAVPSFWRRSPVLLAGAVPVLLSAPSRPSCRRHSKKVDIRYFKNLRKNYLKKIDLPGKNFCPRICTHLHCELASSFFPLPSWLPPFPLVHRHPGLDVVKL